MSKQTQISFRVSASLMDQLDSLREWIEADATLSPSGSASRSTAIRLAMLRGVEILEHERNEQTQTNK